jgi:hypothetical protein
VLLDRNFTSPYRVGSNQNHVANNMNHRLHTNSYTMLRISACCPVTFGKCVSFSFYYGTVCFLTHTSYASVFRVTLPIPSNNLQINKGHFPVQVATEDTFTVHSFNTFHVHELHESLHLTNTFFFLQFEDRQQAERNFQA